MGVATFTVARSSLLAADRAGASTAEVCEAIVRSFHQVARFDWCAVMTTDPDTHMPSGGVVEGFSPDDCVPFWDNELLDPDFNKFSDLARRVDTIATLQGAVDGDLRRSPRYTHMYAGLGAIDELRMAFVAGTSCLAVGVFVRSELDGPFTIEEVADVRELVPVATRVLRRAMGRGLEEGGVRPPVVILLDAGDHVTAMTPGGRQVLDDLRTQPVDGDLPGLVQAAAARVRSSPSATGLTTRVRDCNGRWLRMHASPVEGEFGSIVLTIEPAAPDDLVQILLESYELTRRETEIALCICRGLPTRDIAAELMISAHTVRDHIKVIFAKAGVSSRGELMAELLTNHMFHRFHDNTTHLPTLPPEHPHEVGLRSVTSSHLVGGSNGKVPRGVP
jgi:DNA-binding CsgD family transcriptional regulator